MEGLSVALHCGQPGGFALAATMQAGPGRITGIFGPSAAGKTTLLRAIAGLANNVQGHVALAGETWLDSARALNRPPHRRGIGHVAQHDDLFPHLDVAGNLALAGDPHSTHGRAVCTALGIDPLFSQHPGALSGGQGQRVCLARALLRKPRLLLLDEPFGMLDLAARREMLDFLGEWVRDNGVVALLTSHLPEDLAQCAADTVLIEAGQVTAEGPTAAVLNDPRQARRAGSQAGSLLHCEVMPAAPEHGLTPLQLAGSDGGHCLWVAHVPDPPGAAVRLYVHARDVSLARTRATDSSIQNILTARVRAIAEGPAPLSLVSLEVGGQQLHACVTGRALSALQLTAGDRVYAQVKSVSLLG